MEPRCKFFGECGGCTNQHVPYDVQLVNKRKNLASFTNFPVEDINVISGDAFSYRNRMDFVFSRGVIGFRKKGIWHNVVDVDNCPISNSRLNELLGEVREFFMPHKNDFFDLKSQVGLFRYAVIRTPSKTSTITIILNDDSPDKSRGRELVEKFSKVTSANNVLVGYNHKQSDVSTTTNFEVLKGSEFLEEEILGKTLRFHSQAFFQNNTEMARELVSVVRGIIEREENNNNYLLDLYGGVGTFGICLSDLFREVTVVECVEPAIVAAKKNAELNNITNLNGFVLDAGQINRLDLKKPLTVITDPPRSGMTPKAIERLRALRANSIIYVSCNAQQLQRELPKFKEYFVKSVHLVDLFPQTNHFEAVVELILKEE